MAPGWLPDGLNNARDHTTGATVTMQINTSAFDTNWTCSEKSLLVIKNWTCNRKSNLVKARLVIKKKPRILKLSAASRPIFYYYFLRL